MYAIISPSLRTIFIKDSLPHIKTAHKAIADALREWYVFINQSFQILSYNRFRNKICRYNHSFPAEDIPINSWVITSQVPITDCRQHDGDSCGVFVAMAAFHFFMTGKVLTNADFLQDGVPAAIEFIMYQISLARDARELEDGFEYAASAPLLYTEKKIK